MLGVEDASKQQKIDFVEAGVSRFSQGLGAW